MKGVKGSTDSHAATHEMPQPLLLLLPPDVTPGRRMPELALLVTLEGLRARALMRLSPAISSTIYLSASYGPADLGHWCANGVYSELRKSYIHHDQHRNIALHNRL